MAKPQVWDADQFSGPEWRFRHVMARHALDARVRGMGLDRLAKLFPAPPFPDELT